MIKKTNEIGKDFLSRLSKIFLAIEEGDYGQKLGRRLRIHTSYAFRILGHLEDMEFIERKHCPDVCSSFSKKLEKTKLRIFLTKKGKELERKLLEIKRLTQDDNLSKM